MLFAFFEKDEKSWKSKVLSKENQLFRALYRCAGERFLKSQKENEYTVKCIRFLFNMLT